MEIGNLKARLRQYRINFKRNKKKIKAVIYKTGIIVAYPFILIVDNFKKEPTKETKVIVNVKNAKLNEQQKENKPFKQQVIKKNIIDKKVNIEKNTINKKEIKPKSTITKKEIKVKNIIEPTKENISKTEIKQDTNKATTKITYKKNKVAKKTISKINKKKNKPMGINIVSKPNLKIVKKPNNHVKKVLYVSPLIQQKTINKLNINKDEILKETIKNNKEIKEKIFNISSKIESANYKDLYEYEKELKDYISLLNYYKERCKINNITIEDDLSFDLLEQKIKALNKKISNKKDELYYQQEVKEEVKEEKKEEKKDLTKYEKMNAYFLNELQKQELVVQNLLKRPDGILASYKHLTSGIFPFLFTYAFTKNNLFSILVSTFFIHNNLVLIKSLTGRKKEYEFLQKEYISKKSMLNEIYRVSNNNLEMIQELKEELKYYPVVEVIDILKELDQIEKLLIDFCKNSKQTNKELGRQYKKVRW